MATTRTLTGTSATFGLHLPAGNTRITVDPEAAQITVTLTTTDDSGASADAIAKAVTSHTDSHFMVYVPDIDAPVAGGDGGTIAVSGNSAHGGVSVSMSVGTISGNAEVTLIKVGNSRIGSIGPDPADAVSPISAEVTIPAGATLLYSSVAAHLTTIGHLAMVQAKTVSGRLHLASVETLCAATTSGQITADTVFGSPVCRTLSGAVTIGSYQGHSAQINTTSGDVRLNAGRDARGTVHIRTVSGDVTLRGTDHLTVTASTNKGSKSIS